MSLIYTGKLAVISWDGGAETLTRELRNVHDNVNQWNTLGRFRKAFHSADHSDALKDHQRTIQTALEEIQVSTPADFRHIAAD